MYRLRVESHFDASHVIPKHPGKCKNLHGHHYRIEVFVIGKKLDSNGILENSDFGDLKNEGIENLEKVRVWESPTQYAEYREDLK